MAENRNRHTKVFVASIPGSTWGEPFALLFYFPFSFFVSRLRRYIPALHTLTLRGSSETVDASHFSFRYMKGISPA